MEIEVIPDQQTPIIPEMVDEKEFISSNKELLDEFLWFAKTRYNACGLASNQVSVDGQRLMHRFFALMDLKTKEWRLIINPTIDEYIGIKELKSEGCLTWVGKKIISERSRAVKVTYFDIEGNKIQSEFHKGFNAQIWQHEINHLNGVQEQIEENNFKLPKEVNIGRNDSCPCNSGKKYKQCCLLLVR